jgi:hypothetical protein
MAKREFTTPVGRLVMGSLYKPQTTDADGHPLVVKQGVNQGQPKVNYFFALAIPKGAEQHWSQTPWGQDIYNSGKEGFPQAHLAPSFAWKVVDGDSTVPNKKGIAPSTRDGYRGNWVISFNSGFASKIYNKDGSAPIVEPDAVKLGYYVQVNGTVDGNNSQQNPGVFINHNMVALSAYGEEIFVGADPLKAGFGDAALPAGALATPPANSQFSNVGVGTAIGFPQQPQANAFPHQAAQFAAAGPFTGQQGGFPPPVPNRAILNIPTAPAARQMTPLANGATYEQMIGAGWTEALLREHGMLA